MPNFLKHASIHSKWYARDGLVYMDDAVGSIIAQCDNFDYLLIPRSKRINKANAELIVAAVTEYLERHQT